MLKPVENMLCTEIVSDNSEQFLYTTCSPHVLQKEELLTKIYLLKVLTYFIFQYIFIFQYMKTKTKAKFKWEIQILKVSVQNILIVQPIKWYFSNVTCPVKGWRVKKFLSNSR